MSLHIPLAILLDLGRLAQALTFEVNAVSVVKDAIEHGVRQGGISNDLVPWIRRDLAGDDQRAGVVQVLDDFQEIAPLFPGQWLGGSSRPGSADRLW
jgi:urease gamma subunit